jgi:transcriptional regulator with XRE-family HTH domain
VPPTDLGELARSLRSAREAKGLTQGALARALGLGQQTVSKWETGAAKPRPQVVAAVAEALSLAPARLLALAGYIEVDAKDLRVAGAGTDLDELREADGEAYELVMDMARSALVRARQRQRSG